MSPARAAALARFSADLAAIWPEPGRLGLAVSGGPDSLALLALAHAVLGPARIAAASVDHGLRAAAAGEAAGVAALCANLGVAHATITLTLAPGAGAMERARAARYAALGQWCQRAGLAALVTAHHADDQAETMLMRLNRGAGLRGLAAMRPRARVPGGDLPLLRPLLGWRRAALVALVADVGWSAVDDPTNRDTRYERARVRAGLATAGWIDVAGLAQSAAHCAEADAALEWAAATVAIDRDAAGLSFDPVLPRAVALRVLERVVADFGAAPPRGSDLARWHDRLASGAVATLAGVRGDGRGARWRFRASPPHRR